MQASLIFPHQLFRNNPAITGGGEVYLFEDPLYFCQYKFHKKKLVLHRASMKYYESSLKQKGIPVVYAGFLQYESLESLFQHFSEKGIDTVKYVHTDDYLLERRIKRWSEKFKIGIKAYENPLFLLSRDELQERLGDKKSYFMASFYKVQRKEMDLLMTDGEPTGGKWSFDEENRKKLPADIELPTLYKPQENEYLRDAIKFVDEHFADNPGDTDNFMYPITHYQAEEWLKDFIRNRLRKFGDYEDALSEKGEFLFHSVLTPSLNIGLITPEEVIEGVMKYANDNEVPLNSLEGFIRQVIGWREFMRGVYHFKGTFQRKRNYFGHSRKIPLSFWTGETGIPPVDDAINKILKNGYAHHIERLMVLGNFMLLCEFDPDEVYRWFMELFIDAYDWVMVPNVYGMTQYADNGLITTKPYISGSNYIRKMSHYRQGEWSRIWDALYWRFLDTHKESFRGNQRMNMVLSLLDRMDRNKLDDHLSVANEFLEKISE